MHFAPSALALVSVTPSLPWRPTSHSCIRTSSCIAVRVDCTLLCLSSSFPVQRIVPFVELYLLVMQRALRGMLCICPSGTE
ncbi:hypothetical protein OH76DRAFT_112688 [Lentinus brumalis]|uniref:Uncharacterized protein n=1 Tax=Lentinus brumalis TaxID=2498619 RepID=A0A371CPU0_9APHY|nr:hypothetical protein OH76DRAFT_112688 [Polyporus brumalis]